MFLVFPRIRLRISVFAIPSMLLLLWWEGALPFFILVASAAVHELGHIIAIYSLKHKIRRVDILPMGALIVVPEGLPYLNEMIIALAGPALSILCGLALAAWFLINPSTPPLFAMLINITLGIFNLLPIKKLDGGKALYSYLALKNKNAELVVNKASLLTKLLLCVALINCVALTNFNFGVIILSAVLIIQLLSRK